MVEAMMEMITSSGYSSGRVGWQPGRGVRKAVLVRALPPIIAPRSASRALEVSSLSWKPYGQAVQMSYELCALFEAFQ